MEKDSRTNIKGFTVHTRTEVSQQFDRSAFDFRTSYKYRGSPHSAFFGGKKKSCYAKSRYASPILVLKCKHGGKTFSKSTF